MTIQTSFLWTRGKNGSDKTTLAKLAKHQHNRAVLNILPSFPVFRFFFIRLLDFDDDEVETLLPADELFDLSLSLSFFQRLINMFSDRSYEVDARWKHCIYFSFWSKHSNVVSQLRGHLFLKNFSVKSAVELSESIVVNTSFGISENWKRIMRTVLLFFILFLIDVITIWEPRNYEIRMTIQLICIKCSSFFYESTEI